MKKLIIFLAFCPAVIFAQISDSTMKRHDKVLRLHEGRLNNVEDSIRRLRIGIDSIGRDLAFSGTRIISRFERTNESPRLIFGGYVSTYIAWYSDTADQNNFQKFPTADPQSNAFSVNVAQITAKYAARSTRANIVIHYGDMPRSAWSPVYNYLQEANAGIRILKKTWLDVGFFRTHIGLESVQPRENIATSVAVPTFFEPYYLSGAKLSYVHSEKLTFQVNAFNSFNGFVETNSKKAIGASCMYEEGNRLSVTFNSLWNDDAPDADKHGKGRLYNNLYLVYRVHKFTVGAEANYGFQLYSQLNVPEGTAQMFSGLVAVRYQALREFFIYARGEYFYDPDEMLTGPEYNQDHQLIGLQVSGGTVGAEFKPHPNTYIRLESRLLRTHGDDEKIFLLHGHSSRDRMETLLSVGVWF